MRLHKRHDELAARISVQLDDSELEGDGFSEIEDSYSEESLQDFKTDFSRWWTQLKPGDLFDLQDLTEILGPNQNAEYRFMQRKLNQLLNRKPSVLTLLPSGVYVREKPSVLLTQPQYDFLRWAQWFGQPFTLLQAAAMLERHKAAVHCTIVHLNKMFDNGDFVIESPGNAKKYDNRSLFYWQLSEFTYGMSVSKDRILSLPGPGYMEPQSSKCKTCIGRSPREGGIDLSQERRNHITEYTCEGIQHVCHNSPPDNPRACREMADLMNRVMLLRGLVAAPTDDAVRRFSQRINFEDPYIPHDPNSK